MKSSNRFGGLNGEVINRTYIYKQIRKIPIFENRICNDSWVG